MKPVLAALTATVLCTVLRVSVAQEDANSGNAADAADGLISSWTLLALEHVEASSEPTRARGARGLLILDGAGNVFEYFTAGSADESAAAQTDAQRIFAEHGGFWGRYQADAAEGRITFEAADGVSPSVHGLTFSRTYD